MKLDTNERAVINHDSTDVPPFGVMEFYGVTTIPDQSSQSNSPAAWIQRPTIDGRTDVLFNGPAPITANGGQGAGHYATPSTIAAYDQANEENAMPAHGDIWGVKAGSWYLAKSRPGFKVIGPGTAGFCNVMPQPTTLTLKIKVTSITPVGTFSFAGTTSSGSAIVTAITSTANLNAGAAVYGAGIPDGTAILSVDSSTQVTLTNNATASASPTIQWFARYPAKEQYLDSVKQTNAGGDVVWFTDGNLAVPTLNAFYGCRLAGYANGKKVYEFAASGSGGGGTGPTVTVVTEVCPIYGTDTALYTGQSFTSGDILTGSIDAPTGIGAGGIIQGQAFGF